LPDTKKVVPASFTRDKQFAIAYADQTEHDWRLLLDAIEAGRITTNGHDQRTST
jgi:hypothetical protein